MLYKIVQSINARIGSIMHHDDLNEYLSTFRGTALPLCALRRRD